jgi:hypothetical protein
MPIFHYMNSAQNQSHSVFSAWDSVKRLIPYWQEPLFRLDRIIFPNRGTARKFLAELPGTKWGELNTRTKFKPCLSDCDPRTAAQIQSNFELIAPCNPPAIRCNAASVFDLSPLLDVLNMMVSETKLEILSELTPDPESEVRMKSDLKILLQDVIPTFHLNSPPRCSIVHSTYEIDGGTAPVPGKKKQTRRTRRPSAAFQQWFRRIVPQWYPAVVGNEYYGHRVFSFFVPLLLDNHPHLTKILPSAPMRHFDFADSEQFELRFDSWLPFAVFSKWMEHLYSVSREFDDDEKGFPDMLHFSCTYNKWQTEGQQKHAGQDQFAFTWNDPEFAFQQHNSEFFEHWSANRPPDRWSIYFQLTPRIDDDDFRITLLEEAFGVRAVMR